MNDNTLNGDLASEVITYWENEGVIFDYGVTSEALDAFEKKYSIKLPSSFRKIYIVSDGTAAPDCNWFIFDQLESIDSEWYVNKAPEFTSIVFANYKLAHYSYQLRIN